MENIFSGNDLRQPAKGTVQVINRKKYDTDSAELLWSQKYTDFENCRECGVALFKKKNGEFFRYDCYWCYSSQFNYYNCAKPVVTPLTEDQAKDLTEKFSPEDYIDIFGDVDE